MSASPLDDTFLPFEKFVVSICRTPLWSFRENPKMQRRSKNGQFWWNKIFLSLFDLRIKHIIIQILYFCFQIFMFVWFQVKELNRNKLNKTNVTNACELLRLLTDRSFQRFNRTKIQFWSNCKTCSKMTWLWIGSF